MKARNATNLMLALAIAVLLIPASLFATFSRAGEVWKFTANTDASGSLEAGERKIVKAVRIIPSATSKSYILYGGTSASDPIVYQEGTKTTLTGDAMHTPVQFNVPAKGLYLSTTDTTPTLFLYFQTPYAPNEDK